MNKIIIVYGEMGMGKNFVGDLIAQYLKLPFIDGDFILLSAMLEKVRRFKPLTAAEIDNYVKTIVVPFLVGNSKLGGMVFAQALYRAEHRQYIEEALEEAGIEVVFVLVPTHSIFTHLSRLLSRPRGIMWAIFGLLNKPFFQKDGTTNYIELLNDSVEEVILDRISKIKW